VKLAGTVILRVVDGSSVDVGSLLGKENERVVMVFGRSFG